MAAYVYRLKPTEETLVLADSKIKARQYLTVEIERLTTDEVMAAMDAGTPIIRPNEKVVDPDQQQLPIPQPE